MAGDKLLAAVIVKSPIGGKPDARRTLVLLGLERVNTCVVVPDNPTYRSMLQIAKDYVTWGDITREFAAKLLLARGRLPGDKPLDAATAKKAADGIAEGKPLEGVKKFLRLHPPKGGFKRTLKRAITSGGETGDRGDKIEELLGRMS